MSSASTMTNKIIELFIITLKEIGKLIYRYIVMVYYKCTFHFELSTIWLNYHTRIPKPPPHPVTSVSTSGSDDCGYPPLSPLHTREEDVTVRDTFNNNETGAAVTHTLVGGPVGLLHYSPRLHTLSVPVHAACRNQYSGYLQWA